ncbi:hypothetical protein [Acinetobacter haemolyticus]|uniref:hypothetical protein n=1 Tax=Acinetobacter haemolyticus TaxID=29430 RepID=UPI001331DEED|nr:hypothetical protein [Acinetobacter haemolyticus]QHI17207.1 hypothetical protein AhaeAN4_11750 [Acinetobacter haemolyticus]
MRSELETLEQYQESMKEFNESTRLGFEEFIQQKGSDRNKLQLRCTPYTSKKGGYGSFDLDFGLSVYQHQQTILDVLQKRINDSIFILSTIDNPEEAYKSIDLLLRALRGSEKKLEQALKGGAE